MSGPITRDSIENANHVYNNPYNLTFANHPSLKKARGESYLKAQDTLESRQERLERQMISEFHKGLVTHDPKRALIIAKMGKNLFYATSLPFFYLFVGFPRSLKKIALDPFFLWFMAKQQAMLRIFKKMKIRLPDFEKKKRAIEEFLKAIQKGLTTPLRKLAEAFRHFATLKRFLEPLKRSISAPFKKLQAHLNSLSSRYEKEMDRLDQELSAALAAADRKAKDFFKPLAHFAEKVQKRIEKAAKPFQDGLEGVTRAFQRTKKWMEPKIEEVGRRLKIASEWMERLSERSIEKASFLLDQTLNTVKPLGIAISHSAQFVVTALPFLSYTALPFTFLKREGLRLAPTIKRWKERARRVMERGKRACQAAMRQVKKAFMLLDRFLLLMIDKLKVLIDLFFKLFSRLLSFFIKILERILYIVLVIRSILRIGCKVFFILAREAFLELREAV